MHTADQDLWQRLSTFRVDDDTARLSFLDRLARENRWDRAFTDRVFAEYRRFVFLAITAGHQVTPSEAVDQAWHLHLTYTHSYWGDLCGDVLGRPLHHQPTVGGAAQGAHWDDTYTRTLASYETAFGEPPPADIWPTPDDRFADPGSLKWVDTARYWTVPKRPIRRAHRVLTGAGLALMALVGFATAAAAQDGSTEPSTAVSLLLLAGIFLVAFIISRFRKPSGKRRTGDDGCGGCGGDGCGGCGGCGG